MAVSRRRLIAAGWAMAWLQGCERGPASLSFRGIDITGADYAREFDLPDADGQRRRLSDFKGKVTVVFFGYTHCPDVCPTTMIELAAAKKSLGADGQRVQGVFITLDPERDTPPLLKAYVANFDPGFVALRGTADQTRAVAQHFKVFYIKMRALGESHYTIDHTAGSYIFDAQGRVRIFTRHGTGADALVQDLKVLLALG